MYNCSWKARKADAKQREALQLQHEQRRSVALPTEKTSLTSSPLSRLAYDTRRRQNGSRPDMDRPKSPSPANRQCSLIRCQLTRTAQGGGRWFCQAVNKEGKDIDVVGLVGLGVTGSEHEHNQRLNTWPAPTGIAGPVTNAILSLQPHWLFAVTMLDVNSTIPHVFLSAFASRDRTLGRGVGNTRDPNLQTERTRGCEPPGPGEGDE
jgi:hypothetical protein